MNDFSIVGRRMAIYVCRACGAECAYPARFKKCPVCGIKWG